MYCRTLIILVLALVPSLWSAPVFESVAELVRPGSQPMGRLLYLPADGNYYGTTATGGVYDHGTVFRLTPAGQVTILVSFTGTSGSAKGDSPIAGLVLGPDGALYGTTEAGGAGNFGTVYRVTNTGTFSTLVEFTGPSGLARGSVPHELVFAPDGFFYGVTEGGGTLELGTVFRLSTNGLVTTLVDFSGTSGLRKGSSPAGALVFAGGILFGVTQNGGASDFGTVYSVTTNGMWGLLAEFTGVSGTRRGSSPSSGLVIHPDGAFYGTTSTGGNRDAGTVFRVTPAGSFTVVREFSGPDGSQPAGPLLIAPDGGLLGTTSSGGGNDFGTIFRVFSSDGSSWVHSLIAEFSGEIGPAVGAFPESGLCLGPGGQMFGTTSAGGPGGFGTIFSIATDGTFTHVANFTSDPGWHPAGGPVLADGGDLLLPLYYGGVNGYGALGRFASTGLTSTEAVFGGPFGQNPEGGLVRLNQTFFGVTRGGGTNARGTFFRLSPGVGVSQLGSFNVPTGSRPEGPLTPGDDGYLYGVAREGGANNRGAIVRLSQDGTRILLASFTGVTGISPGQIPRAPLAWGQDGKLYGVTERGGANDQGTIFSVKVDGTLTPLMDFAPSGPRLPLAGLTASFDGNLYGTTSAGGTAGAGTVFRFSPPNSFSVVADFTGATGAFPGSRPVGPLTAALDGTLYGVTSEGGDNGQGTIYRIAPGSAGTKLFAFTGVSGPVRGSEAVGGVLFGTDGFLYGAAASGGMGGGGTVFRLRQLGPHVATNLPAFSPGTVMLRGSVQTGGEQVSASFEYGTTPSLGSTLPAATIGGGSVASFSAPFNDFGIGTTVFFRARATNPSGTSLGALRSFVLPGPFDAWRLENFGTTNIPELGDFDGDGLANLLEYALLSTPTAWDWVKAPVPVITTYPEGRRLSTTILRDPARTDITIQVQSANTPDGPWSILASSSGGSSFSGPGYVGGDASTSGIKTVEIRDTVNVTEAPGRFLRVRVSIP